MMMMLWIYDEDRAADKNEGERAGTIEDSKQMAKDRRQLLREWMTHGGEGSRLTND